MGKDLYIAEKPSVAREFAGALKMDMQKKDGYLEGDQAVVTWCVGHLVTMSYPEVYDEKYKKWSLQTLPFVPETFLYEVIPSAKKQFQIVSALLNRSDISTIYVCTDSGREGEYIYRLVDQLAKVTGKIKKRVWIDSQTEEEILRGIREAKDLSAYDALSESAYLRAKEDYLMGINFSRVLTLQYGNVMARYLNEKYVVVSVGRVMTCVLGMVVRREREIRNFTKTPFFRVIGHMEFSENRIDAEWRVNERSLYFESPLLYKENGFLKKEEAERFIEKIRENSYFVKSVEKKKENKNPPLLYNLAELQNECSRYFKISPDETLAVVQELYEKKLVTYPRTDARVLSTAVAKEIHKNIQGLSGLPSIRSYTEQILKEGTYKSIAKTRYVNDKQITDHYAIIPTGQGLGVLKGLTPRSAHVYELIVRRFLAIFYPPAVYQKVTLTVGTDSSETPDKPREELFTATFKVQLSAGYLDLMNYSFQNKKQEAEVPDEDGELPDTAANENLLQAVAALRKGTEIRTESLEIKEGETSPPKRYNSGSLILAMENAGQLIEDEELRSQIKGSGIGTSATRAEILKKLIKNKYLSLNKKTQIITPAQMGEMIYDVVNNSIRPLLNAELTASWEKGLTYVAEGSISEEDYMKKLKSFIEKWTHGVRNVQNQYQITSLFNMYKEEYAASYSAKDRAGSTARKTKTKKKEEENEELSD